MGRCIAKKICGDEFKVEMKEEEKQKEEEVVREEEDEDEM